MFHIIYSTNLRSATIINLKTSEVMHVTVSSETNRSGHCVMFSSTVGELQQFVINLDSDIETLYIRVQIVNDEPVINFVCTLKNKMTSVMSLNDNYTIGYGPHKYGDFIKDFCKKSRIHNIGDPILTTKKFGTKIN